MTLFDGLFYSRRIYDHEGTEKRFLSSMKRCLALHAKNCPEYAKILDSLGFSVESFEGMGDLHKLPPLPTAFLKRRRLLSVPEKKLHFKSETSGTSGVSGFVGFDARSCANELGMALNTFRHHKLISPRPTNYVVLGYEPSKHNNMGVMKTAYTATLAAPALRRVYALRRSGTGYELNLDGVCEALMEYERQGAPVRFMGFPAYFSFLMEELKKRGIRLKLHPKSLVMLAGGWKRFFAEAVSKEELYAMAEDRLGLSGERVTEFFGAVEHPIIYCDCKNHRFHVPVYSRVIIRDPGDLSPLPFGRPGIMNLITPVLTGLPYHSVMTDDIAVLYPGESCGCGIASPWFEILGRAGMADIKTCAVSAAELLGALSGGGRR